ncbi:MAG: thiamine pyrophosphate-binding protein [Alphaproteobacteria bacterium]|nr:thiamine pyrophosphate-binding protein [Alphaproteobacteria bacterium]
MTGGAVVAEALERAGIRLAFGLVSVHNMPILEAVHRRGRIRFVPTRNEAGAAAMADAFARAGGGLAAVISSTGPGAANAVGSLMEALNAGSPILHVTGQVPAALIGRGGGSVHDTKDQARFLEAVSKAVFRPASVHAIAGTIAQAVQLALTPPCGPVSIEVPIDVQKANCARPATLDLPQPQPPTPLAPSGDVLDRLAARLAGCRRAMLWTGAGATHARGATKRLAALGFGMATSMHGRGTLPEDHPLTLGAFNVQSDIVAFYRTCDAMLVAGSRLRGHETSDFTVQLPQPLYQIDVDAAADGRTGYAVEMLVQGDAALALDGLADRLQGRYRPDPAFAGDLAAAKRKAVATFRGVIGHYAEFCDRLRAAAPRDTLWVRDITISNSSWGNKLYPVYDPRDNIYAVGAAIGLGLPMAIGAALGAQRAVICLSGDGGFSLNIAEALTAVEQRVKAVFVVMNDGGYGIIRNIQHARCDGYQFYTEVPGPDLGLFARAVGMPHWRLDRLAALGDVIGEALSAQGPALVEVDVAAIGPFPKSFPPVAAARPR